MKECILPSLRDFARFHPGFPALKRWAILGALSSLPLKAKLFQRLAPSGLSGERRLDNIRGKI